MAISDEKRVEHAIRKYTEHFDMGLPIGFAQTELKDANDADEWEQTLNEAIKYDEPFDYCCEGVFSDDEIIEQERLRASRKARIKTKKGEE